MEFIVLLITVTFLCDYCSRFYRQSHEKAQKNISSTDLEIFPYYVLD